MKKLGMVIINYNDFKTTSKLIDNIKNYAVLDKIVVVDNCSTDDSYKKLLTLKNSKIDVIKTVSNKGYADGLNYGAKYLNSMYEDIIIIFSNSDVIIKNEADLKLLKEDIENSIKVVGPVIEEHGTLNRGWKMTSPFIEILSNLPLISRYFKKKFLNYTDSYYKEDKVDVDVVSGCFFLVDGKTLEEVNYFDEKTFLYYEEFILATKLKKIDKKEIVDNRVHIIHDHSITIDKSIKRINKYKILKNSQRYFVKEYLKANVFEMFLLLLTNKISLLIFRIKT